jgi:hypothetical protein
MLSAEPGAPRYEIVTGERRWRAVKLAALTDIPVAWCASSPTKKPLIALVENIQREDLTPAEEARATETLVRKTLDGKGRARPPELSVVSEVLGTAEVRVQLQQKSAGSDKVIIEFADTSARDTSSRRSRPRFRRWNGLWRRVGIGPASTRVHSVDRSDARRPFSRYP